MKFLQVENAFSIFKNILGTPSYWKAFRNDILAKMEQLGPFQIFFTLSCAEMRWPEILVAILKANGHKVEYLTNPWDGKKETVLIDGINFEICT